MLQGLANRVLSFFVCKKVGVQREGLVEVDVIG